MIQVVPHSMAATRRLHKELSELVNKQRDLKFVRIPEDPPESILQWTLLLLPMQAPYAKGAFRLKFVFPAEYPFKPPKVTFQTKIYHPNIDEKGQICLPIISPDNWKPATKVEQVLHALVALIHEPEPDHPLRGDLAEEFIKDKKKFIKRAEDFTKKHAEQRP